MMSRTAAPSRLRARSTSAPSSSSSNLVAATVAVCMVKLLLLSIRWGIRTKVPGPDQGLEGHALSGRRAPGWWERPKHMRLGRRLRAGGLGCGARSAFQADVEMAVDEWEPQSQSEAPK